MLCTVPCYASAETNLTVMSFNVRFGTAKDGPNAWSERRDMLVDVIRQHDPDVIGTQECLDFQADYIVQALPQYRWFGVGREADGSGERMAVLYKKDVVAPMETGNFWLSETPDVPGARAWDAACNRMVTWARFHHYASGESFHFLNTHFDHLSAEARTGEAGVLRAFVATLPKDAPIIVTGDFNAKAGQSEPWRILIEGGLSDAWEKAKTRKGPTVTFNRFEFPHKEGDARIDWILFRGPVTVQHCETVTHHVEEHYPSDHFPIVVRVTISPKKK